MAVHFDATTLRDIVGDDLYDSGSALLDSVTGLEEADGGVSGVVTDPTGRYEVWAGIVDQTFAGECSGSCPEGEACVHSVALALAGIVAGLRWSASTSVSPGELEAALSDEPPAPSPAALTAAASNGKLSVDAELRLAVDALAHADLVDLVVTQALADPDFAATVRARTVR